jgi:uncharacterized membrane protein YgcG
MSLRITRFGRAALLLGGLLLTATVQAQGERAPPYGVRDEAGLFSREAKETANAEIDKIHNAYKRDIFIETLKDGPTTNVEDWAAGRAEKYRIHGIYVVITTNPHKLQVEVDRTTRDKGLFSQANARELSARMLADLKAKKTDAALLDGMKFVQTTIHAHAPPAAQPQRTNQVPMTVPPALQEHSNWLGYACLAIAALIVVWLVIGIFRGLTNRGGGAPGYGGGGPGYGGGGGGYGGGGGGGGFMSSMFGGLFGAVAGNWMYNNFLGGHNTLGASQPPTNYGNAPEQGPDYTGAGGDWSDPNNNPPPPDAGGAAGGDWGGGGDAGGGDAGGGGDWGGGGGGGGDWGGGGGGGGDFGGGGGGGDW